MTDEQSSISLSDDTGLVKLYPPKKHKNQWYEEAEERGTSASKYLQELIQEARFLRQQGQLKIGDRRQVDQLKDKIEHLENQLENATSTTNARVDQQELVTKEETRDILTGQYTPIDRLLGRLLQDEEFRRKIRLELETQLYALGDQSEAAYRRGQGWKNNRGDR